MPEATVMVAKVGQASGKTAKGRDWTITRITDGNGEEYGTFDQKLAVVLLASEGKRLDIAWDVKDDKNNLTSAVEHVEKPKAGGYDDPVRQHRITVLACMKVAAEAVLAGSELPKDMSERVKRIKIVSADLAVWVDEYAERAANPPFAEDDGIEFAPEMQP